MFLDKNVIGFVNSLLIQIIPNCFQNAYTNFLLQEPMYKCAVGLQPQHHCDDQVLNFIYHRVENIVSS